MNEVDRYLVELGGALVTRGRRRRRALAECREHLRDAAAEHGEVEAVRRFGAPAQFAAAVDGETALRRAGRATVLMSVGVVAVAGSTLALLSSADADSPVWVWAVLFFGAAQTSAVAGLLAVVSAVSLRRSVVRSADLRLLARRNLSALGFALLTEFAAAAAMTGQGSVVALLGGPAMTFLAVGAVWRAHAFARRVDLAGPHLAGARGADLPTLSERPLGALRSRTLLLTSAAVVAPAAFVWNDLDGGSIGGSCAAAGVETGLLLLGFVVLGRALGLRQPRIVTR